jgi:hypothetical protein
MAASSAPRSAPASGPAPCAGSRASSGASDRAAGQLAQFGAQPAQHAGKGARVGAVQHQQVGQRQQVVVALVAGAEGDGAVEQLQQQLDAGRAAQRLRLQEGLQRVVMPISRSTGGPR